MVDENIRVKLEHIGEYLIDLAVDLANVKDGYDICSIKMSIDFEISKLKDIQSELSKLYD